MSQNSKGETQNNILLTFGNWCLPAPSTNKPEEREFVVDSGASMHMISKKDLNSAELETVTTSRSPTTVITTNGKCRRMKKQQIACQRIGFGLDNESPRGYASSIPSLGKLCDEHGHSYEWIKTVKVQNEKFRTNRGSWFIYNSFKLVYLNIHDSFRSGN